MDIQINLERAIHQLVDEFLTEPYRFFSEADAVSRFHQLLEADPTLSIHLKSKDGIPLPLIHQEYPAFFRMDEAQHHTQTDPSNKAQRGKYDVVILAPGFIKAHPAAALRDRDIPDERVRRVQPFQAVIEFRMEDRNWNSGRTTGAKTELQKLILSKEEAELRYFVGLMRYTAPTENRWNKYWPEVTQAGMAGMEIHSIFATYRVLSAKPPHVQSFGDWCSRYEEGKKLPVP